MRSWLIINFRRDRFFFKFPYRLNSRVEDYLNDLLAKMAVDRGLDTTDRLTEDFHVYPDFHGNRSPVADPTLKGMVRRIYQPWLALYYIGGAKRSSSETYLDGFDTDTRIHPKGVLYLFND